MIGDIFSMIFALVGAVLVIAFTYYASKWYARRMGPLVSGRHIKVIDRLPVSKNGAVLIIEIEGKQYMIGAAEQSVALLKELEEPVSVAPLLDQEASAGTFSNMLHLLKNKMRNNERGVD